MTALGKPRDIKDYSLRVIKLYDGFQQKKRLRHFTAWGRDNMEGQCTTTSMITLEILTCAQGPQELALAPDLERSLTLLE